MNNQENVAINESRSESQESFSYSQMPVSQPVTESAALVKANEEVDAQSKKVKCSSITLIVLGLIGVIGSFVHGFGARHIAEMMMKGPPPHHGWNHEQGPPPHMTEAEMAARGSEVVTRDEFALYDYLRSMSFFTFMMSVCVMIIGKCGLRSTWIKKSKMAKRIFRKGKISCAVIFFLGLFAAYYGHEIHHIKQKQMKIHHEQRMAEHQKMTSHEFMGVLRGAKTTDECKAAHGKEGECNADAACVWCACSAVPSGCFAVDDAAKLPAAVFTCDKKEEAPVVQVASQESVDKFNNYVRLGAKSTDECKATWGKEGECNADADCVWCACSAVPSGCFAVVDAAKLPSAIFKCDTKEEAPVVPEASPEAVEKFDKYVNLFGAKTTDECKAAHGKEGECNADAACVWCACSAVPSGCFAVDDAAKLPSAIFKCDTKEEAPVVPEASPEAILKFNSYIKVGKDSEECKAAHAKEGECNTDPDCVWCACSAVPSSCFSAADAARLPSAVFKCDTKEEVPAPRPRHHRKRDGVVNNWAKLMRGEPLDDACEYSSADECNAHASDCSWCTSGAVKAACRTLAQAKSLPSSIFACSNLSSEDEEEEDDEEPTFMGMFRGKHQRGGRRHEGQNDRQGRGHHEWKSKRDGRGHHGRKDHGKAHRAIGPIVLVFVMIFHFCNMKTFITKLDKMDEAKGYVSECNGCPWSKKWNKKEGKRCQQKKVVVPQQQPVQVSQSPVIEYAIYEHNDTQVSEAPIQKVHYMVPKETTMMV